MRFSQCKALDSGPATRRLRPDFGKASGLLAQDIDLPGHLRCLQLPGYWYSVCSHPKSMNGRENHFSVSAMSTSPPTTQV